MFMFYYVCKEKLLSIKYINDFSMSESNEYEKKKHQPDTYINVLRCN